MTAPRDLTGTPATLDRDVHSHERLAHAAIERAEGEPDNPHQYSLLAVPSHLARGLHCRYGRGDTFDDLRTYFREGYVPALQRATLQSERLFPEHRLRLHFEQPASWMLLCALVCFDADGSAMAHLERWFTPDCTPVLYGMVLKAFLPGYRHGTQLERDFEAMPHENELVSVLLQPRASWSAAFGAYMRRWPILMKRHGYREHPEEGRRHFNYFPLHLGLAVCAYDVDDSALRHLPYYPRDLVDYYRAHIRHTRDAWRSSAPDPAEGLPEHARPLPPTSYALSKAQAYARWLALVCGEQPEHLARAHKALGKRKTMPALDVAMAALASAGLGLHADLKDDETVFAQAAALCLAWQMTPLPAQADAQRGPAGISAMLNALQARDTERGQRLVVLSDGGDNWNALFYRYEHEAEFARLCEQLQIKRLETQHWQ